MKKLGLLLLGILLLSCRQREEIVPDHSAAQPQLRAVSVSGTSLQLPDGGEAVLEFTVTDPLYAFNYAAQSAGFQLRLMRSGGQEPAEFRLVQVTPGAVPGHYSARVADEGTGQPYSQSVCLAVINGDVVVASSYFTVSCLAEKHSTGDHPETGLPVLYLDTQDKQPITSKEDYVAGSLYIRGNGAFADMDPAACEVRGRGNTTWEWPKKPYLVKLEKKASLLGMPKHKRWVLLANFCDRTLMRNLVSMKVASLTRLAWTPRCESVELVLNGKHMGNYLLIEQVRVDKDRVDIVEMTPEDNEGDAVTGGYLLELDFHFDNEIQWRDPHGRSHQPGFENSIPFGIKFPDPEDLTLAQLGYIKGYVYAAAGALYGPNSADPEKGYAAYLDVDSFIDYWLVFEVMGNHELGNPGSVFFHKDRGGKLVAGPCWDFDWGVLSYKTSPQARTGLINRHAIWYSALFDDPSFRDRVRDRFLELLPQLQTIPAYMDQLQEKLQESARLNFKMWNPAQDASMNGGDIINGDENMSFDNAVARLKANYKERLQVIQKVL